MGMNPTDLTNENRKYTPAPSVREAKPDWSELPPALTAKIETLIGSNITDAKTAWGGYSNAFSALVQTENHKTYYIKGSHPEQMSHGAKHLAQEVWAYENCAAVQKMAPAFIGTVAEGGEDDWRLAIWQGLSRGEIRTQWRDTDYQSFAKTWQHALDGSTGNLTAAAQTNFIENIVNGKAGWRKFTTYEPRRDEFSSAFQNPEAALRWLDENIDRLTDLAKQTPQHKSIPCHFDMRSDNILFVDQTCYLIDWPNLCAAPFGYDLIYLTMELSMQGNGPAETILKRLEDALDIQIPESDVRIILSQLCGYLALQFYREVPTVMPRLRWLQRGVFQAGIDWAQTLKIISKMPEIK